MNKLLHALYWVALGQLPYTFPFCRQDVILSVLPYLNEQGLNAKIKPGMLFSPKNLFFAAPPLLIPGFFRIIHYTREGEICKISLHQHGLRNDFPKKRRSFLFLDEAVIFGQEAWPENIISLPSNPSKNYSYLEVILVDNPLSSITLHCLLEGTWTKFSYSPGFLEKNMGYFLKYLVYLTMDRLHAEEMKTLAKANYFQAYQCSCGGELDFETGQCLHCGKKIGNEFFKKWKIPMTSLPKNLVKSLMEKMGISLKTT